MQLSWKHAVAGLALVAAATTAVAQQRVFFGIATGGTGGTYYPLGGMPAAQIVNKATAERRIFGPPSPIPTRRRPGHTRHRMSAAVWRK